MAASMLGLLGVSLFILGTNASPNVPDLDVKKLAGTWYLLGTAFGAGWIENPIRTEMVSKHLVMLTATGDVQVDSLHMTRKPEVSLKIKNKLNQVALKQNFTPVKTIFLPYQVNPTSNPYRNHHSGCTQINYTRAPVQGFSFSSLQQEFKHVD